MIIRWNLSRKGCCNMRAIAESIKRLYEQGRLTGEQLTQRVGKGTITLDEYNEIIGAGGEE